MHQGAMNSVRQQKPGSTTKVWTDGNATSIQKPGSPNGVWTTGPVTSIKEKP